MSSMLFLLLLNILTTLVYPQSQGDSITVHLPFGSVKGYSNGDSWQFYRIPFAAPPIGNLRWAPPSNFTAWSGDTLDAKYPPPACIQKCLLAPNFCAANMSEDCLYINIFIPLSWRPESKKDYNILLYIHGGSFTKGTSGCLIFDSRYFSKFAESVIVTFNYRLGALGFLRHPQYEIYGNMGFRDQIMAMQWVKDYISYFGGKGKTTLFGESAGAISVAAHLQSPSSHGLFDNIIIESDPWTVPLRNTIDATYLGKQFMNELGCSDKSCLYTKSSSEILLAQKFMPKSITPNLLLTLLPWSPIIDDIYLTKQPYRYIMDIADGNILPPAIIGGTTDEGYLFIKREETASPIKGQAFYYEKLLETFPLTYLYVIGVYNSVYGQPTDYIDRLSLIMGDYLFLCPTRHLVATISKGRQKDIWSYLWHRGETYNATNDACYKRPCHESELPYVFGSVSLWGQKFTPNDLNLSKQIQTYWKNMANKGNPNTLPIETEQFPVWPRYETEDLAQMLFNDPIGRVAYAYRETTCNFLDTIGYDQ
ncbi:acetylcholinesterase isoform E4-E6 precursor [Oopsacas minuta]|uniref:Acetylcholinesterase isoform E4-E6 n=1 Tax=Oopsacas minuta TaxID=111878 RepID=A0AAV7JLF4_9METZ|nr:acetylcholinesterase isoform E4-E6 precursor [Oopsacas minuta]